MKTFSSSSAGNGENEHYFEKADLLLRQLRAILFTDADVFAGTESHMAELAQRLQGLGVAVRVACPLPSPLAARVTVDAVPVVPIPKRGLLDAAAVRTLVGLLRTGEVDLLHAHNGRTALLAALAVTVAGCGRCVVTQHFLEPSHVGRGGVKGALSHQMHRWVSGRMARFIAISDAVRHMMLARADAPDEKIIVVPNGISAPEETTLAPPSVTRAKMDIGLDVPLIVCVARLETEKDVPTLIAAMTHVAQACPVAVCVVAGDGSQKETLQAQIQAARLERSVRLLGFQSDALSLIRAGDVFVLPSVAEPFGLVLLEAMALKKPVVAVRAGGPVEIVEDGATGLLVPPADPHAMADALRRLLADPLSARRMGAAGRVRFEERFTARQMADATLDVYHQAMGIRPS